MVFLCGCLFVTLSVLVMTVDEIGNGGRKAWKKGLV